MASCDSLWPSRMEVVDGHPARLMGEEVLVSIPPKIEVRVKSQPSSDYETVRELCCTSHRLHYASGNGVVGIRLDSVIRASVRGGFLRPPKLVLEIRREVGLELSIRVGAKDEFNGILAAVNRAIADQVWIRTGGFISHPRLGGVSRVVARVDQSAYRQGIQIDSGLSDLESVRANAKQLKETISNLKRGGSDPEVSEINALLSEYGLLSSVETSSSSGDSSIEPLVRAAVSSANGVMLVHDLFCLINRKLRIERSLAPKEFIGTLSRIPSVQLINVCGYKVVISLRLTDINSRTVDLLVKNGPLAESAIASALGSLNGVVLHLLLLKAEESFGSLVRDQHDVVTWYVNTLI